MACRKVLIAVLDFVKGKVRGMSPTEETVSKTPTNSISTSIEKAAFCEGRHESVTLLLLFLVKEYYVQMSYFAYTLQNQTKNSPVSCLRLLFHKRETKNSSPSSLSCVNMWYAKGTCW